MYALIDRLESRHSIARATWAGLLDGDSVLLTTNYTLLETAALVGIPRRSHSRLLERDGDPIILPGFFRHVIRRRLDLDRHRAAALDVRLEQRIVVLHKKLQKLLLLPPLHLLVILHDVRLIRRSV